MSTEAKRELDGDTAIVTQAEAAPDVEPPERAPASESATARLLALQRTAGNAAVVRMLARRASEPERLTLTELKFACFFIPRSDPQVGAPMRKLMEIGKSGHRFIDASSLEDAIEQIAARVGGKKDAWISEIVLVAHGRPDGRIDTPVRRGGKDVTPETLIDLQADFRAGQHKRYQAARKVVVGLLDERSNVVVRGCRAGLNPALTLNLVAFFGGQATVYIPKVFYGVDELTIGGPLLEDEVAAYDFLESKGFIPYGEAYDDKAKKDWVGRNLPNRRVPEAYLLELTDDEKRKLKAEHKADDPEIQHLKDYEGAQMRGVDKWDTGRYEEQGRDDEMEEKATPELEAFIRAHVATLRGLQERSPNDWKAIGREAWLVSRAHRVWSGRGAAIVADVPEGDPLGGMTVPGLSYDLDELALLASRRGDLRIAHHDAFYSATLENSELPVDMGAAAEASPLQAPASADTEPAAADPDRGSAPRPGPQPGDDTMVLPPDTIHSVPKVPAPAVDIQTAPKAKGDPYVIRGEFNRVLEFKYEPPRLILGGWLVLKKTDMTFSGKLDYKGGEKAKLYLGGIGQIATGAATTRGGGDKAEAVIVEGKDKSGAFGRVKGGLELGGVGKTKPGEGAQTERGMKAELYASGEVGFGFTSVAVKVVFIGFDETKSVGDMAATGTGPFKILAVKISFIPAAVPIELPLEDGRKAVFTGQVSIGAEVEPNWPKILPELMKRLGREVVKDELVAVAASSTPIATGAAAVGAGELLIAGGFLAGAGLTIYAYYRAVQEVEGLRALKTASNSGWADFRAGFLDAVGIGGGGKREGPLYAEGQRHGKTILEYRLKGYVQRMHDLNPERELSEEFLRARLLGIIKADERRWSRAVDLAYEVAVRTRFLEGWRESVKGTWEAERDDKYAVLYAGLGSREPNPNPDTGWFQVSE